MTDRDPRGHDDERSAPSRQHAPMDVAHELFADDDAAGRPGE